jgi:hypothetical protein
MARNTRKPFASFVSFVSFVIHNSPRKHSVQQRLEQMLHLALRFALLGASLGSVQIYFMQAAEQGGSPAILLAYVIQSLLKGLLLPLIPCQFAQLE